MEPNELEQDNIPEEHLQEEAEQRLANKPSPKLQAYLDKYQDVDFNTAKRNGVHGVKMMLDDYQSGALKQKYPYLPDDEIVSSIEQQEAASQEPDDSFLAKAMDVPKQVVGGFRDAAQAVIDLSFSAGAWGAGKYLESQGMDKATIDAAKKDVKGPQLPEVSQPKSMVGGLVRGVSQFLAPFGILNKAGKAAGLVGKATSTAGKFAEASAIGAATDFMAFGEHEKRLSDLIESNPTLSNPVTRYLKSNPNDGVAEGRFKNALEGLGLGAATEGMFRAVKWIRDTKVVKDTAKQMQKEAESRMTLMDKSYDDLINEIKTIPLRNKKTTTLSELSKSAEGVNWTKEDLLSGKAINELDAKSTQPLAIKATQIQEEAFNKVKEAIPDYRARIDAGDMRAIDDYWGEMTELHKLDFVAKDIAAKHGGAEAMVYRRHNTAVEQSNAMYKIFAKADTLDKRKMVEAHMNILESKGDIDGFVNALTMGKGDKLKQVLKSVYIANILSSPVTHFKNVVSTSLNSLVYAPLEQTVAAGISSVRRKLGSALEASAGQKIANGFFSNLEDGVQWKESQILFHSQMSAIADGVKYIGRALRGQTEAAIAAAKKGEKLSKMQDIVDASKRNRFDSGVAYDNLANSRFDAMTLGIEKDGIANTAFYHMANFVGNLTKKPGSLIQTYDDAMKGMYFKAKVEAQAYRLAVKEGLEGPALQKRWRELYDAATYKPNLDAEMLSQPKWARDEKMFSNDEVIKNLQEDGLNFAEEYTFTKKLGSIGNSFQNLRDNIDKAMPLIPGGSIIMPFMKTPINLMKFFMVDRGPLAPLSQAWRADFMAGGARADMAMARLGTGTAMFGLGYYLAANGYVFGDGPKNPAEKALHRELGIQERSVRIGDKFFDIGWIDPVASFLLYPANIIEMADKLDNDIDDDTEDKMQRYMAAGVLGMSNLFLSKSFTMGLSELASAITDQDEKSFTRALKNYAAALAVPNAVSYAGQIMNPAMQDADSLWETIKVKAGVDVRQRRDIFGREVTRNPKVNNYMFPISYSNWKNDETVAKMIDAGAYVTKPKRVIEGVRLSYDQYDKLMSYMQEQDVYGQIKRLVDTPMFNSASNSRKSIDEEGDTDFTKKLMIQLIYRENLKMAKAKLVSETPELQNKILDFKLKSFNKPARTVGDTRLLENLGVKVDSNK